MAIGLAVAGLVVLLRITRLRIARLWVARLWVDRLRISSRGLGVRIEDLRRMVRRRPLLRRGPLLVRVPWSVTEGASACWSSPAGTSASAVESLWCGSDESI